ncbi:Uncharacterised protein [Klebsiella variicola]|uniref:Uncharacterized protein n=1 Tax=Klebsiella variicola TaxID=244366 RepID=A0ABD7PAX1_KLEVA|nr:Uncharacterised protein [Klebsiella variicola]SXL00908.1 Uncharacterised protein [Klebsiella pneumoniae]
MSYKKVTLELQLNVHLWSDYNQGAKKSHFLKVTQFRC